MFAVTVEKRYINIRAVAFYSEFKLLFELEKNTQSEIIQTHNE